MSILNCYIYYVLDVGVIILAGGKSSRMGEDKGLMILFGKPMIDYVIEIAKQISEHIIIVANNEAYERYGYKTYPDIYPDKGPLGGTYTGLTHSEFDINIVLSCDVPYVKPKLIEFLIQNSTEHDITIPFFEERTHQLIGVYKKSCLSVFRRAVELGELKITSSFNSLKVNILDASGFEKINFKNVNSKRDISQG